MYSKSILRIPAGWTALLLLVLPLWLASCKKENDVTSPNSAEGSWRINALRFDPAFDLFGIGVPTSDAVATLKQVATQFPEYADDVTCFTETRYTFNSNGSVAVAESPKCASSADFENLNPVDNTAKWKVENNKITLTDASGSETYDFSRNGDTMNWSVKETDDFDGDGKTETVTLTLEFKKI